MSNERQTDRKYSKKASSRRQKQGNTFTLDEATELGAFSEDSVTETEAIEASEGGDDEKE